jgi:outer membrane immunogenic protein
MRGVWRLAAPCWPISALLVGVALLVPSGTAFAQSSLGAPLTSATGRSLADAVGQNENELIGREVLGGPPGGVPAGRSTTSGGGGAATPLNTFSTGRVRGSDHDALTSSPPGGGPSGSGPFPYDTREYSSFGNVVVTVPGTVLGGQLKLSGFVGRNDVFLRLKSDSVNILDPDQSGAAFNQSIIFGGTALWAKQNTYALATLVGTIGQSTLKDTVDDCYKASPGPPPTGFNADFCHHNRYNFNTAGIIATATAGHVIDLGGGTSGPKLDLRGSIGYTHNAGDRFTNISGDQQQYTFSTWTGTAGLTLFSNMTLQGGALLRPYIQGYVRQEWGYDNRLDFVLVGSPPDVNHYDQAHTYGGVDGGFTYTQGNTTFGAAVYYEASGSERTLGGRLGMSQKLDSLPPKNSRPFNWSGFYIGVNAGGASATSGINSSVACRDNDGDGNFACPFTTPEEVPGSTTAAPLAAAGTGKLSDGGFTGGGQVGYNLQTGGFVFGLELDAESFRLGASRSVATAGPIFITSFDTNWLFTARTRIGLPVTPSLLLYATTGFALTDLSVGNSVAGIGAASSRGLVTGRTIGAGAEWALNRDWTLRGEYLYVDFGNVTTNAPTAQPNPVADFNSVRSTADLTAQIVRLGLNYRF